MDKIWIKYFIETGKGKQKQSSLNAKKTIKASELKKIKQRKQKNVVVVYLFQKSLQNYIFKNPNFHYALDLKSGETWFLIKYSIAILHYVRTISTISLFNLFILYFKINMVNDWDRKKTNYL